MSSSTGRLRQIPRRGDHRLFVLPAVGFAGLVVAEAVHLVRMSTSGFSAVEALAGLATLAACVAVGVVGLAVRRNRRDSARLAALQNAMPFAFTEQFYAGAELVRGLRLLRERGVIGGSLVRRGTIALAADTESVRLYTGWREPRLRVVLRSSMVMGVTAGSRDSATGPMPLVEITVATPDGMLALPLTLGRTTLMALLPVLEERARALSDELHSALVVPDLADR